MTKAEEEAVLVAEQYRQQKVVLQEKQLQH
jgi:hypothetical protein